MPNHHSTPSEVPTMPYNELRKDYLLDRWVVIATERARRPTDFAKQKKEQAQRHRLPHVPWQRAHDAASCTGLLELERRNRERQRHSHLAPQELAHPLLSQTFTPLSPRQNSKLTKSSIMKSDNFGFAVGHHEVLVESPNHDEHPANAELPPTRPRDKSLH